MNQQRHFICGNDDFLVDRAAVEIYKKIAPDESSIEIFNCSCSTINETMARLDDLCISLRTWPMFCTRKFIWLRNANFLCDNILSKSEIVREKISTVLEEIQRCAHCDLILSASPVDRRSKFVKAFAEICNYKYLDISKLNNTLSSASKYFKDQEISLTKDFLEKIVSKIGSDSRTLFSEIDKLITYIYPRKTVSAKDIDDIIMETQASDFFETVDLFFQKNSPAALDALHKYFIKTSEARPLLAALQSRNRLMLQISALRKTHSLRTNFTQDTLNRLEKEYKSDQNDHKSKTNYSIFKQNLWYVNRVALSANMFTIKQLMSFQFLFSATFFSLIKHYDSQKEVMVALYKKCTRVI
ncbi:MAG: hypothetical protein LBH49_03560 [Puniceicoccales bacterium]|jgi:DNA polymerase-3 subunit delta|nr:hypothetical protein [Puniceicoccales bacterium]